MKKIISIALCVLMLLSVPAFGSLAQAAVGGITAAAASPYVVKNGVLTAYTGSAKALTIPANLKITSIAAGAFKNNAKLESVVILEGVKSVSGFEGCYNLKTVKLPSTLTTITAYAFDACRTLNKVTIPAKVTSIGKQAFSGCYMLTSITIPNSVKTIGERAFYDSALKTVKLGSAVTSIGKGAFQDCHGLTAIVIPDNVKSIGAEAFWGCGSLKTVSIGSGVTSIGAQAFAFGYALTGFTVSSKNPSFSAESGVLFNKKKTALLKYPNMNTRTAYSIPKTVTSISDLSFYGSSMLKSITIPNGVKNIGRYAFSYSYKLESIVLPNSVQSMGVGAFECCGGLKTVKLGTGLTGIAADTFAGCELLSAIVIPNSVKTIGDFAFAACVALKTVKWGSGLTSIGEGAFRSCYELTSITIPNSVRSIGAEAFAECRSLKTMTVGSNVTQVGAQPFGLVAPYGLKLYCGKGSAMVGQVGSAWSGGVDPIYLPIDFRYVTLTLGKGESYKLTAYTADTKATVTWSSSDSKIATVSANGTITGKGVGTAKITAKTAEGKTASCTVTVKKAPSAVKLDKTSMTLGKGEAYNLKTTLPADSVSLKRTWKSSDTKVATVSSTGKITAVGTGTATISLTLFNGKTASCVVNVKAAPTSVKLNKSTLALTKGKTATLTATLSPSGAASFKKTWSSSNTKIATVDANGKVKAVGKGTATITFKTFNNKTQTCKVTVK